MRQVITRLLDDLDGGDADETVEFGLDGIIYRIDLSAEHAAELRGTLARYIAHGQRVGRATGKHPRPANGARLPRAQTQAIRDWATANGYRLSERGRIPRDVLDAYKAAH